MAKPSIFSKNYEKKMKRRRLRITLIIVVLIAVSLGLFYQFKLKDMDFNQIINSLQAWVNNENAPSEEKKDEVTKPPVKDETPEVVSKAIVKEYKLLDNETIKVKVLDENGNVTFSSIEEKGYYSSISSDKKEMVVLDKNQNMFLLNVTGDTKNITKQEYVSSKGTKYPKDAMLAKEKGRGVDYLWEATPKFIDENTIAYISNLPYFGASAKNKYIWIYDIVNNTYKPIYKSASPETELIGDSGVGGKLKVKIGNDEYNLDNKGNLSKE
ncbi:MAG: hypothetical protein ACRC28_18140 [Clostridium sp.]|uniref:hypothetical protein n=1 Tax=Clostridium sp. TaxID=1506 RepID=UPI003F3E70DC